MKVFINDWGYNVEDYNVEDYMNKEENREYTINEWITDAEGSRAYLVSAYVYDDFVMFFYMYEFQYKGESAEPFIRSFTSFEYEINNLKANQSRCGECMPREILNLEPNNELWQDKIFMMQYGEYVYLCNLMKETGRIPESLEGKELAFKKVCVSFEKPVDEINYLAVYPEMHRFNQYYVGKTFKVAYGTCDIKIPYTIPDTGEESYIIVRELKIHNMMESFDANYEKYKEIHKKTLRDFEENKDKYGENHMILSMDDMRNSFDATIFMLTLLSPKEKRSFTFRIADYLNSKIIFVSSISTTARTFLILPDKEDKMEGDLYKSIYNLGEINGELKKEYEITLESVTDSYEIERKILFERKFS